MDDALFDQINHKINHERRESLESLKIIVEKLNKSDSDYRKILEYISFFEKKLELSIKNQEELKVLSFYQEKIKKFQKITFYWKNKIESLSDSCTQLISNYKNLDMTQEFLLENAKNFYPDYHLLEQSHREHITDEIIQISKLFMGSSKNI